MNELARFLTVGAGSALMNTVIIVAFTELFSLHYLISYLLCFLLVTCLGFLANRSWTFHLRSGIEVGEFARYYFICSVAVIVAMACTFALVQAGMPYYVALLVAAFGMAPVNYVLHRRVSFRIGRRPQ